SSRRHTRLQGDWSSDVCSSYLDPVKYVRWQAAASLGHIGPAAKDAVPALMEALYDPEDDVQAAAARAMGNIQPGIVKKLADALRSDERRVGIVIRWWVGT